MADERAAGQPSDTTQRAPDTLLAAKLSIPPTRPNMIPRSRLIDMLNAAPVSKLVLVSAPAGFGKTTLLSAWASGREPPAAWVVLDDADNDLARFLTYFIAALRAFDAGAGEPVLTMLQARRPPPVERLGTALLNDMAGFPGDVTVVLDDYHVIHAGLIHDVVTFLLDHLPPHVHLVISTRSDPPLPLARLRGRGELAEVRAADLRFTPDEASAFLAGAMGVDLPERALRALDAQIEGWAVGLQLAGLALKGQADAGAFIEEFGGSHRYVIDYLTDEVMHTQPDDVRRFLHETSILDSLSPALCDAVTGRDDSHERLAALEGANLFLVPLDDHRAWYRYHQLFRDALRFRLDEGADADRVNDLHRRAADWYARNNFPDEALRHWLAAGEHVAAADLIQSVGHGMLARAQLGKLRRWIDALPGELVRARPWLSIQYAWILNLMGQLDAMERYLQDAEHAAESAEAGQATAIRGNIATVRAGAARKQHDAEAAIVYLREALANLPPDDALVRSSAHFNLGSTYLDIGEVVEAQRELRAAVRGAENVGSPYTIIAGKSYLADAYQLQGKLRRAANLYEEAIGDSRARGGGKPLPLSGYAYSGLGQVRFEQNDLDAAEHHLSRALEMGELLTDWTIVRRALPTLARLQQAMGQWGAAAASWERAFGLAGEYGDGPGAAYLEALQARMWLVRAARTGDDAVLAAAQRWAESYRAGGQDAADYRETFAQHTLAWAEIAGGDPGRALARLEAMAEAAKIDGRVDCLIKVMACSALAQSELGQSEGAQSVLRRALEQAAPEGYCRAFVDFGPPMERLLRRGAANHPYLSAYRALLAAFPDAPQAASPDALVEPLTGRERDVLRLVAAGLSNREIADELYLSVNTIKWYTSQIYGKLGVGRRAEAVDRAHELGIL